MLEKTLESPLNCKEIQVVNPKGNQSWIFAGRTDAEAPILWPPDVNKWFTGKGPDAGRDWRQEEKGMTEDETAGWHHRLYGHEFEQAPEVTDRQGSLVCCVHGVTKSRAQLNWTEHLGSLILGRDEREQKQGSGGMFPEHTTILGVGKPPRPPLQPDPWTHPYPHPV